MKNSKRKTCKNKTEDKTKDKSKTAAKTKTTSSQKIVNNTNKNNQATAEVVKVALKTAGTALRSGIKVGTGIAGALLSAVSNPAEEDYDDYDEYDDYGDYDDYGNYDDGDRCNPNEIREEMQDSFETEIRSLEEKIEKLKILVAEYLINNSIDLNDEEIRKKIEVIEASQKIIDYNINEMNKYLPKIVAEHLCKKE